MHQAVSINPEALLELSQQISELQEQNHEIRARLDELGTLRELERDHKAVKAEDNDPHQAPSTQISTAQITQALVPTENIHPHQKRNLIAADEPVDTLHSKLEALRGQLRVEVRRLEKKVEAAADPIGDFNAEIGR